MSTTVDMTPTWSTAMDIIIMVFESGDDEGRALAKQELRDIGKMLDEIKENTDDAK